MERTTQEWKKYRKKLLINPKFQYSFMKTILGIAGVTILVFYAAKVFFIYQVKVHLSSLGFPENHVLYDFLSHQSHILDAMFAVAALVESIFLVWMGLRLSNRIAGPLYRLRQEMLRVAGGGKVARLKFRDGDYFEELAETYNEFNQTETQVKKAA